MLVSMLAEAAGLVGAPHPRRPCRGGAFLARNWTSRPMVVVDGLGDEFLESVRDGNQVEVREDGTVVVRG